MIDQFAQELQSGMKMMDRSEDLDRVELLKTAYRKIAELRARLEAAGHRRNEPVAIVGAACRMPGGVEDTEAFWQLLIDGVDGTREIPPDRWNIDDYYDPDPGAPNKMYVRRGGFIDNYRNFDPLFFHVSPVEAASMDPQQRLLLEVAWEAFENAGWAPDKMAGSATGVFVGVSSTDFSVISLQAMRDNFSSSHMATGMSPSIAAGHLSYFFGLRGPSMALDTACSSALSAVHLACDSLRNGQTSTAVAGAVSLMLAPEGNIILCKAHMLAPDGHCKTFDAAADGYARGEGCGLVVLKLLSQAKADGDRILAVIRGSASNQDGRTNGITAPSGNAQREVILAAQASAQVTPADIDYVETHGTGTSLGDPIEVQALGEVFGPGRPADRKVVLGAVKSNVGHLEAAAGMAGLIKAMMALQKGEIPPNLHLEEPNPLIPWDHLPFEMPTGPRPWPTAGAPRMAGVSAFGFSGTNVHMILEEPPPPEPRTDVKERDLHLLALSGQTPKALEDLVARYVDFLNRTPDADLGDICFTANSGRAQFSHRLALIAGTAQDMKSRLTGFLGKSAHDLDRFAGVAPGRPPRLGLLVERISPEAGRGFYAVSPVFRKSVDACWAAAQTLADVGPLPEALAQDLQALPPRGEEPDRDRALACALTFATASQWLDWGLTPVALAGAGADIWAAVAAAGAISVHEALRLTLAPQSALADPHCWTPPNVPVISPQTGEVLTREGLIALARTPASPTGAGLERVLAGLAREGAGVVLAQGCASLIEGKAADDLPFDLVTVAGDEWTHVLHAIGGLYARGIDLDWRQFDSPWGRRRLALPTYPFQRQSCWNEIMSSNPAAAPIADIHPLLGRRLHAASLQDTTVYESVLSVEAPALLRDHCFYGTAVVSMSSLLEMVGFGGSLCLGSEAVVEDVVVEHPLLLPAGQRRLVQTEFVAAGDGDLTFSIVSADMAGLDDQPVWERHCTGAIRHPSASPLPEIDLDGLKADCPEPFDPDWIYETATKSGVDYGPAFRLIQSVRRGERGVLARLALPPHLASEASRFRVHPGLLDAALQVFGLSHGLQGVYMPVGVERLSIAQPGLDEFWCYAVRRFANQAAPEAFTGDLKLFTSTGVLVGEVGGILFKSSLRLRLASKIDERRLDTWLYDTRWDGLVDDRSLEDAVSGQRWLVIGAEAAVASTLADRMRARGVEALLVQADASDGHPASDVYSIRLDSGADYDRLLSHVSAAGRLDGVVYLNAWEPSAQLPGLARDQASDTLELVQALLRNNLAELSTLALVTRGFKSPSLADTATLAAGAVWGMGRVIASELPGLHCRLFDLDPSLSMEDASDRLAAAVLKPSLENQIAIDRTDRYCLRLMRAELNGPTPDGQNIDFSSAPVQLEIGTRGDLRQLRFVKQQPEPPGPGEVQLRVLATGMNFRDVLNALDLYPGDPGHLGIECVGEVIAIGPGVVELAVGDQVLAIPRRGYCTYANASINMVFRRPPHLSLEEAATLLVAYVTGTYALNYLGKMNAGERVLIHAGAGGVGLAAVQLAQRAGVEVFATAGSPAKRAYLTQIGVPHVLDSRSLDFVHQIKDLTGGEGVDLVLNSLIGPAMTESLALLRPGGRFLEIGKTDVFTPDQARAINPSASHDVVDLLDPYETNPALIQSLFDDVRQGLSSGELRPLPYRAFGLEETQEAFRYMSAARHIGKVVVVDRSAAEADLIKASGTYLITGGLGGLGLACAEWLAKQGARSIILVSRRRANAEEQAAIEAVEDLGAIVLVSQADVANRQQLAALLTQTVTPDRPLRGVLHCAGVIDDGAIAAQDRDRFTAVMRPKIDGAWNLHELTLKTPLDFFVLFSSGAGIFGNLGQSGYAAANVFLDELARARRSAGLPALSIDWGPWAKVGMAARMDERHVKAWEAEGLRAIEPNEGLTVMERLLRLNRHDQIAVLPVDPAAWQRSPAQANPLLAGLVKRRGEPSAPPSNMNIALRLEEAAPDRKSDVLIQVITQLVSDVFGLALSRVVTPDRNLNEIGMDSLLAIQLGNRLKNAFSVKVPRTLAFEHPTIQGIADYVLQEMQVDALRDPSETSSDTPLFAANMENAAAELTDRQVETF